MILRVIFYFYGNVPICIHIDFIIMNETITCYNSVHIDDQVIKIALYIILYRIVQ